MERILVTGANGFVGRHVVEELGANGMTVFGVGGPESAVSDLLDEAHFQQVDLTNREAVDGIDFTNIDGIIHLAGLAAAQPSYAEPLHYITTNMGIELNLFEAAMAQKAFPKFLAISSGTIYDPRSALPLTETSPYLASSPYAVSKLGQEQLAQYYGTRGFEIIIARPFNHIGPGQGLGFLVPDITKQVVDIERGLATDIVVGNLDSARDYSDVRDIARAYRLLLEHGKNGETYNISSGKALTGHEILELVLSATTVEPRIVPDEQRLRPSDTPEIYGSHHKLTADTGWKPKITMKTTVQDIVSDWRSR